MARQIGAPVTVYRPQLGELVVDLSNQGAHGVYMGTLGGRAYLRPSGGGVEWDTDPNKLEPVTPAGELEPVIHRSTPRRAERIELPDIA
ncbi:hypothetical protein [Kitasatospora kifunensis]|uniref:Uncharacterized protein n=1 Tax=Kitasatospora kifunensis TaxID=58351 RepID=A0A7W7VWX0_KITKI|nr:hypothetical protein [Kitasatospora kifunensis]MBB4925947.1 hypothetical protein [Kitasatospora kifunensis]